MVVFFQSCCIRSKWLYSGKTALFGQSDCIPARMVVFLQIGCNCIRAKVVVIGQTFFYSGKSGCIRANRLYSGKSGCIRTKWLYSG